MDEKSVHLEMRNLKQTELQTLDERNAGDMTRTYENRKPQETMPPTLKRLKRGDNGLERNLKLEMVVDSEEEERRARLENVAAT